MHLCPLCIISLLKNIRFPLFSTSNPWHEKSLKYERDMVKWKRKTKILLDYDVAAMT